MVTNAKGDIFQLMHALNADVFIHQANAQCVMGGGLARQVRDRLPQLYMADLQTQKGDRRKLGTFSTATIDGVICINLYGQFHYSWKSKMTDEAAIEKGLTAINILYSGLHIMMPKIGCKTAGGDWDVIGPLIDRCLKDCKVTIVDY